MILFNSLLVNIATGIAVGYRQLISTVEGRSYLDGNWTLAIEYSRFVSIRYLSYGLVEIVLLLSGSFVSMIFFRWYGLTSLPFIFIANLGGLVSGYIYTSSSCHWLSRLGIIKQTVREHAQ